MVRWNVSRETWRGPRRQFVLGHAEDWRQELRGWVVTGRIVAREPWAGLPEAGIVGAPAGMFNVKHQVPAKASPSCCRRNPRP